VDFVKSPFKDMRESFKSMFKNFDSMFDDLEKSTEMPDLQAVQTAPGTETKTVREETRKDGTHIVTTTTTRNIVSTSKGTTMDDLVKASLKLKPERPKKKQ
jgi:Flp pilus assembly CpaF family ATPase